MELRSSATGSNSNSRLRMDSKLNIAVISDTHDKVPEKLISAIESADEIWHLGDICDLESLQRLRSLGPEFLSVQGNCDPYAHLSTFPRSRKIRDTLPITTSTASNFGLFSRCCLVRTFALSR